MLIGEEDNVIGLQNRFGTQFLASKLLVDAAAGFLASLGRIKPYCMPLLAKQFVCSITARELRRYRALELSLQHGFTEPAVQACRTIFESTLAVRYVFGQRQPDYMCSSQAQGQLRAASQIPMPRGDKGIEYRVRQVLAYLPIKMSALADIHKTLHNSPLTPNVTAGIYKVVDDLKTEFGEAWVKAIRSKGYSGLTADALAESCGLGDIYYRCFTMQSFEVHGNRYLPCVVPDEEDGGFIVDLSGGDPKHVGNALEMAGALFCNLLVDVGKHSGVAIEDKIRPYLEDITGAHFWQLPRPK